MMALRPVMPWLSSKGLAREMAEFDRIAEREALTRGSDPVGAGGAAERAARAARAS
jgi:hypothetical protein